MQFLSHQIDYFSVQWNSELKTSEVLTLYQQRMLTAFRYPTLIETIKGQKDM